MTQKTEEQVKDPLEDPEMMNECWAAVVRYTLELSENHGSDDAMAFLRNWNEGEFATLLNEWPEAPEEVYYADPTYHKGVEGGSIPFGK